MSKTGEDKTILFFGDSITDCGRDYNDITSMGFGYVRNIANRLKNKGYRVINSGISGHRVIDLNSRLETDCLSHRPDLITVFIGINDCWRKYDQNDETSIETFTAGYHELLTKIKARNKNVKLIIMEPFVLPYPADRIEWRETLDPQIQAVRHLAREFNAVLIPLDGIFAYYYSFSEPESLAVDGVHPSEEGHAIISDYWIKVFEKHISF